MALFRAGETTDAGDLKLRTLTLSDGADAAVLSFYNEVELAQAPDGKYARIRPQAGRAEEQARRIAGNMELFYFPRARAIGELSMKRGTAIARWYLEEALRVVEGASTADEVADGDAIMAWAKGKSSFTLNELTKYGPGYLRPKGDAADKIRAAAP